MSEDNGRWALVTGASTGIGYHLAICCAEDGYNLLVCADEDQIKQAAEDFRERGTRVEAIRADLATESGVADLYRVARHRDIHLLVANAGIGLGDAFLDEDLLEAQRVIDTNVSGTLSLIHKIGHDMRQRSSGRILITGSIAGFMPGSFQAVYNGTKAFLDSFAFALGNELKQTGVTVTCLMPGPTDTPFFERAGLEDTKIGAGDKDDPAEVAKTAYKAMMDGRASVVTGFMNKVRVAFSDIIPEPTLAEMHRRMAEPGSAPD
ncbi:SDR family NAD(P)-dependent oxidoreductase [Roseibium salinum]